MDKRNNTFENQHPNPALYESGIDDLCQNNISPHLPALEFLLTCDDIEFTLPDQTARFSSSEKNLETFNQACSFPCTIHGMLLLPNDIDFPKSTKEYSIEKLPPTYTKIIDWTPSYLPYTPLFIPEVLCMVRITFHTRLTLPFQTNWLQYFSPGFIQEKKRKISCSARNSVEYLESGQYRLRLPEEIISTNKELGESPQVVLNFKNNFSHTLNSKLASSSLDKSYFYISDEQYKVWIKPRKKEINKGFYLSITFEDNTKQYFYREDCTEYQGYWNIVCSKKPLFYELFDSSSHVLLPQNEFKDFFIQARILREECRSFKSHLLGELMLRSAIPTYSDIEAWLLGHSLGQKVNAHFIQKPFVLSKDNAIQDDNFYKNINYSQKDHALLHSFLLLDFAIEYENDLLSPPFLDAMRRSIKESLLLFIDAMLPFWMLALDTNTYMLYKEKNNKFKNILEKEQS